MEAGGMNLDLATFKKWARIAHASDDDSLTLALNAAITGVEAWTGADFGDTPTTPDSLLALAVFSLANHYRHNVADVAAPARFEEMPLGLRRIFDLYRMADFTP
jgi:hypothetical protein